MRTLTTEAKVLLRDFVYSMRDAGIDFSETKRLELEHMVKCICKSILLEAEIRMSLTKPDPSHDDVFKYGQEKGIEDCIKIIDEMMK
jgi:hypothetical protein